MEAVGFDHWKENRCMSNEDKIAALKQFLEIAQFELARLEDDTERLRTNIGTIIAEIEELEEGE